MKTCGECKYHIGTRCNLPKETFIIMPEIEACRHFTQRQMRDELKRCPFCTFNTRPIEDEKDKVIAKLKGNWDYLKEYLVALRNSRLHEECLAGSVLNRFAISFLDGLIEKMNAADNNVGSMEKFERDLL